MRIQLLLAAILGIAPLFASGSASAGVKVERLTDYVEVGQLVYWRCTSDPHNQDNVCVLDPDGTPGGDGYYYISGVVNTHWNKSGVYRVATGSAYCGTSSCGAPSLNNDTIIVAPKGGWPLDLESSDTTVYVDEPITFTADTVSSENGLTFQWSFGDGTSEEDFDRAGSSTVSKSYSSPGSYVVKVHLEDYATDIDFENSSGGRVQQQVTVNVRARPVPPPAPVSNLKANLLLRGYAPASLYTSDQDGKLWYDHHTDTENSFWTSWDKPADASTRVEYRVDFGTVGKNAQLTDMGWTHFRTHSSTTTSGFLSALPPALVELYYANKLGVPDEPYSPNSDDHIMIYYRLRTQNSNGSSAWRYLPAIWFWYRD